MNLRKLMAGTLAMTMVVGSSMTVFAEDANSATGTGTSFDHVNKDIISVTLPTTDQVANVFNYYVDPERLIDDAESLADGSTQVTPNAEGVYFKNSGAADSGTPAVPASAASYSIGGVTSGLKVTIPEQTMNDLTYLDGTGSETAAGWYEGTDTTTPVTVDITDNGNGSVPTPVLNDTITVTAYQPEVPGSAAGGYSNKSDAVAFEGKNSVDVDVTVNAAVTANADKKDIALVKDAATLSAATDPALLMTLKVGDEEKAITADGASASATIEGIADNFAVTAEDGKFVYKIRTNIDETPLTDWNETSVQLIGKTNKANVPEGASAMTAPQITLTWSVAKHADSALEKTTISGSANTIKVASGVNVTSVTLVKPNGTEIACTSGTHYTFTNSTLSVTASMLSNNVGGKLKVALSTGKTEEVTIQ